VWSVAAVAWVARLPFANNSGGLICVGFAVVIILLTVFCRRPHRVCPKCREVNRIHACFCAQCGTALEKR